MSVPKVQCLAAVPMPGQNQQKTSDGKMWESCVPVNKKGTKISSISAENNMFVVVVCLVFWGFFCLPYDGNMWESHVGMVGQCLTGLDFIKNIASV